MTSSLALDSRWMLSPLLLDLVSLESSSNVINRDRGSPLVGCSRRTVTNRSRSVAVRQIQPSGVLSILRVLMTGRVDLLTMILPNPARAGLSSETGRVMGCMGWGSFLFGVKMKNPCFRRGRHGSEFRGRKAASRDARPRFVSSNAKKLLQPLAKSF